MRAKISEKNIDFLEIDTDEKLFENLIIQESFHLYPDFFVFPFNYSLESDFIDTINSTPDLIFISKNYDFWYICEVELSDHSIENHIFPQMHSFYCSLFNYSSIGPGLFDKVKETIEKRNKFDISIDFVKLENLISFNRPDLLVIINRILPEKRKELLYSLRGISKISVLEIYKSKFLKQKYLTREFQPNEYDSDRCLVKSARGLPFFKIDKPALFDFSPGKELKIILTSQKLKYYGEELDFYIGEKPNILKSEIMIQTKNVRLLLQIIDNKYHLNQK